MINLSFLSDGRAAAALGALLFGGLSVCAALDISLPWPAMAGAAALVAAAAPSAEVATDAPPPEGAARIAAALTRTAAGDLNARIIPLPADPAMRAMAPDLNRTLDTADALVREVGGTLQAVARGRHYRVLLPHGFHGDFARVATVVNHATATMADKVRTFQALTDRFEARVVAVSDAVTASASALETTARSVSDTVARAQGGAHSIAGSADAALGNVDSVAAAAHGMDGAMATVSSSAAESADMARRAVGDAKTATAAIEQLSKAAKRIDEVVQMIKGVSDYTKLLAVNASVEAARAGEAGKGFAVVATVVQSLATQPADATRKAAEQIRAVQAGMATAAAAMTSVSATIDGLAATATDTTTAVDGQREEIRGVVANMDEAARSSRAVAGHVQNVSGAIAATEQAARDVLAASHHLSEQAADLRMELEVYLAEAKVA
jgi:methyl-accepting chemotaxis protein